MKREEYEAWEGLMVAKASLPPPPGRRAPRCRSETVLGFDTEYNAERQLLSVQFAGKVNGSLVSEVYRAMAPSLTPASLLAYVRAFVAAKAIDVKITNGIHRVTLVAHFAAAEIGMFVDAVRDLDVRRVGRGHIAQTDILEAEDGRWRMTIIDLFNYFPTSLKALGEHIGLPKLEINAANIEEVMFESPAAFRDYAARDAEIAFAAFAAFRERLLADHCVDAMFHPSLAAVAGDIFRWGYFKVAPAPYKTVYEPTRRKRRNGEWTDGRRAVRIFNGVRDARINFIRSMHGGRNEAFTVGLYVRPVLEADVTSMYPAATLIQGLPEERTPMRQVSDLQAVREMEGAGAFEFRFPPETLYPCLPVRQPGRDKLVFPSAGVSNATFAEVREALDIGASIRIVSAHGFEVTPREQDHDLARFIRDVWRKKLEAKKGTLEYLLWKEILNSSIGKLGQRTHSSNLPEVERMARRQGLDGAGALIAADPDLRNALRAPPSLGSLWSPERLALITGRARALMAQLVRRSGAHLISTDSIIADASAPLDCDAVRHLRGVGSDLKIEKTADAALIVRSRMYVLLRRADALVPCEKVIASDDTWAVVKVARQGTAEPEQSFARTILSCIKAGEDVATEWTRRRLLSVDEAIRLRRRIGDEVEQRGVTKFRWDQKRRLHDRDCPIFRRFTRTTPYRSEERREGAARAVLVRSGRARRRAQPISERKKARIAELLRGGMGIREVARRMKVAASTVSQINAQLIADTGGMP